jgi:thymidylate synthase
MKQYLDLLNNILDNGVEKESGRANMPNIFGISKGIIEMNLQEGFPLLTTKKMYWKGIIHELLWFLRGETNIKYLVDNDVNIWNKDAYRWYQKYCVNFKDQDEVYTLEEFLAKIKEGDLMQITKGTFWKDPKFLEGIVSTYKLGDLGKVYGYQWRNQNGVDQIKNLIESLKNNPYSRYHILNAWHAADIPEMALPPCHLLYQFIVRPLSLEERRTIWNERIKGIYYLLTWGNGKTESDALNEQNVPKFYLDLNMYQRSCDTFLGVPFNLASMSTLLMIIAKACNMLAGVATWIGGDVHLYLDHIPMVKEQLSREPYELSSLRIKKELNSLEDILALTIDDFQLLFYKSHPAIKAELFTGLKK